MICWKDFYIDESPNGIRYFIDGTLVSRKDFEQRREKECSHRFAENLCGREIVEICKDCAVTR